MLVASVERREIGDAYTPIACEHFSKVVVA